MADSQVVRFGIHDVFERALDNWDHYRWKSSRIEDCKDLSKILMSLGHDFQQHLNVGELLKFICIRDPSFINDDDRKQLESGGSNWLLFLNILSSKGRVNVSMVKLVYLALLDSYENGPLKFQAHNDLARKIVFRCSVLTAIGAGPRDMDSKFKEWEKNELQDLLRIIPHLSAHSNPELQADVAREFMKHLGFEQEDLGEGVTYTVQDICKKWYSQRECKDGAFDDLVAALLKTKSMGRLVSCIGLPTCHTNSHGVLNILEGIVRDEAKCRLYLHYLGFEEREIEKLFDRGKSGVFQVFQMPVLFTLTDENILRESLQLAGVDLRDLDFAVPCDPALPAPHPTSVQNILFNNPTINLNCSTNSHQTAAARCVPVHKENRKLKYKEPEDSSDVTSESSIGSYYGGRDRRPRHRRKHMVKMEDVTSDDDVLPPGFAHAKEEIKTVQQIKHTARASLQGGDGAKLFIISGSELAELRGLKSQFATLVEEVQKLRKEQTVSRQQEDRQLISPSDVIALRRELVDIKEGIRDLKHEVQPSKLQKAQKTRCLEDIPEGFKEPNENVEVKTSKAKFQSMSAADFEVTCDNQGVITYPVVEPARIEEQDILDIKRMGSCPPVLIFEAMCSLSGSQQILLCLKISGLSVKKLNLTVFFSEQLDSRLPQQTAVCCQQMTEEELETCMTLLEKAGQRMSRTGREKWRAYGKELGLSEETLDHIDSKPCNSVMRMHYLHKHWMRTNSFVNRCIKCNHEVLLKALLKIREQSCIKFK